MSRNKFAELCIRFNGGEKNAKVSNIVSLLMR